MKAREIRSMDKNMFNEKILELKKELVKVNAQIVIGAALKNPGQARKIKKTLAKILTIEKEKSDKKADKDAKDQKKSGVDKKA